MWWGFRHNPTDPVSSVITFGRLGLICLISGFGVVLVWKLMTSGVRFQGLLTAQDGTTSPGRVQLLLATIFTALQYLLQTIHDPTHLPSIPTSVVFVMGGSQAIYLVAKAWSFFGPRQNR